MRDVEIHTGPVSVRGKQLLYSIIHDVTERKRTEEVLAHQAISFFRAQVMDAAHVG